MLAKAVDGPHSEDRHIQFVDPISLLNVSLCIYAAKSHDPSRDFSMDRFGPLSTFNDASHATLVSSCCRWERSKFTLEN